MSTSLRVAAFLAALAAVFGITVAAGRVRRRATHPGRPLSTIKGNPFWAFG